MSIDRRTWRLGGLVAVLLVLGAVALLGHTPTKSPTPSTQALSQPEQFSHRPLSQDELRAVLAGTVPLQSPSGPIVALRSGIDSASWVQEDQEEDSEARWEEERKEAARKEREELYFFMLTYPANTFPLTARGEGYELLQRQLAVRPEATVLDTWQPIGPGPLGGQYLGTFPTDSAGRTTAILIHPQNPDIVYAGGAQGGVWKTTNGGASWTPLTDMQPSLAVGSMAFDPNNPNIIYVGTGEPHGSNDSYYGAGLLKSTNGGQTWAQLGGSQFAGMGIANIVIHPTSSNTIFVAASANVGGSRPLPDNPGIYRSNDGGLTWVRLVENCPQNCTSPSSLVMDPQNPNVLYAAFDEFGIVKSTNGGNGWSAVLQVNPTISRAEVAISPSNGSVLYAGLEVLSQQGSTGILFRSTDGGGNWAQLSALPVSYCGDQCFYDNVIAVQPGNPNLVMAGGQAIYSSGLPGIDGVIFRSADGGQSWTTNAGTSASSTLHPDLHAIAFAPSNPNIVWIGNDGGVFRSTDAGLSWQQRNANMATLQFQSVALHPSNPNIAFGGMQDNAKGKTANLATWSGMDVGDGGFAAIDPFNPTYWYGTRYSSSGQAMQFQRNDLGGSAPASDWVERSSGININDRVLFYAPLATDPNTAGRVYWGTHRLYRSNNRGDSWTAISPDLTRAISNRSAISTIGLLPGSSNLVLVGTADGNVQLTTNGGSNWTNLTKAPLPNRFVTEVVLQNSQTFFVSFHGFGANTPGAPGHVYKTTNAGGSWVDISRTGLADGLPDLPVLSMVLDPATGAIYVGTDLGVYRSTNGGSSWAPYSDGLPLLAVFDLALQAYPNGTRQLVAATHGRSMWKMSLASGGGSTPTPTPTATRPSGATPTPTATRIGPLGRALYLPMLLGGPNPGAATPTWTPTRPSSATNTPTPTRRPPTPTPTPTTGASLPPVRNGNFEQGSNGAWMEQSLNGLSLIVNSDLPIVPRSGQWLAWLGGVDTEISNLSQSFALPAGGPIFLRFYYQIGSEESDCIFDFASLRVNFDEVWGGGLCQSVSTTNWTLASVDLSGYAGQSIDLEFEVTTDISSISSLFLDDVSFQRSAALAEEFTDQGVPGPARPANWWARPAPTAR